MSRSDAKIWRSGNYRDGYVDNGIELKIFPLDLKGRFYAIVSL